MNSKNMARHNRASSADRRHQQDSKIERRRSGSTKHNKLHLWWQRHVQALQLSFSRLLKKPFTSFLTIAVLGVALALPLGLFLLLENTAQYTQGWYSTTQISLYLKNNITNSQLENLQREVKRNPAVLDVHYVSPQAGMKEFEKNTGFRDLIKTLPDNPLPGVLIVTPALGEQHTDQIEALANKLQANPAVEMAQIDMQWVKRLFALVKLAQDFTLSIGILFAAGVLLIIGNTIRLAIEGYHDEINVIKLVGATNAFARRPFLYTGLLFGLFGGLLAIIIDQIFLYYIQTPIANLLDLYDTKMILNGIGLKEIGLTFLLGGLLGWLGAFIAVSWHLNLVDG